MIYLLSIICVLSLCVNVILTWYVRKLIKNHLINEENIDGFIINLDNYTQYLESVYKLEELYGDETIRKAINETKNFLEVCKGFKGNFTDLPFEEQNEEEELPAIIKLKDGEKITQDASKYRRVMPE